jgi:hypothetical protein
MNRTPITFSCAFNRTGLAGRWFQEIWPARFTPNNAGTSCLNQPESEKAAYCSVPVLTRRGRRNKPATRHEIEIEPEQQNEFNLE